MIVDTELIVVDTPKRKIRINIGRDFSVCIRKFWINNDKDGWQGSEMIINRDEWEKIESYRQQAKAGN